MPFHEVAAVPARRRRTFTRRLLDWGRKHGRLDLPWTRRRTLYRVWVSEIMLQQTRAAVVIPYFRRFLRRFPGVAALARAEPDEVLHLWSGLGYYGRARNLHRAARLVRERHGGRLPGRLEELCALPGIGRSTAGAILALARGLPAPVLDGNVRRVLARCFLLHAPPLPEQQLWELAASLVPPLEAAAYTQAVMDLGATVCTPVHPACARCPLGRLCSARRRGCQEQLPVVAKRRGTLPKRAVVFLVLCDQAGRVLLERRPPAGVWGGLWCFPAGPPESGDPVAWCREHFGLEVTELRRLPPQRHVFSHYRLHAELLLFSTGPAHAPDACVIPAAREGRPQRWLNPTAAPPPLGLAAVVRRALPAGYTGGSTGGPRDARNRSSPFITTPSEA